MPRLDKEELKSIIKECLIELLAEGLAPSSSQQRMSRSTKKSMGEAFNRKPRRSQEAAALRKRSSYLDSIKVGKSGRQNESKPLGKSNMKKITSDPLMQDILADTANTTLVSQGTGSGSSRHNQANHAPADKAAQLVQENDPTELFSESAKNWATLAFS